jgi:carboxyl-terminal processing protease
MKKTLSSIIFIASFTIATAQFPVAVDSVYAFMKFNSIHRDKVNWATVDAAFSSNIKKATSLNDTVNCFVKVLEALQDVHSQIYLNNKMYGHYVPVSDSVYKLLSPLIKKSNEQTNKIYTQLLQNKYGYVLLPGMQAYNSTQINTYAQAVYDSVQQYAGTKYKGFIIDLRLNSGGNLYPMLSGLSSFLGNGVVGYQTDVDGTIVREWLIQNGNLFVLNNQLTNIKSTTNSNFKNMPVVVLLGAVTRSSGSMTGIAFKGRSNTVFIGEPPLKGYITSNNYTQFSPQFVLNLATNFVADRHKKVYKETILPDITIYGGDDFEMLEKDKKIMAAIRWIEKSIKVKRKNK